MTLYPNFRISDSAREYVELAKLGANKYQHFHYVEVNRVLATEIAEYYEAMPEYVDNYITSACYNELAREVALQYLWCTTELRIRFTHTESDPYSTSQEMFEDLRRNKHLNVYKGGNPHPLLGDPLDMYDGLTANDLLRAVHDVFGHAACGFQFGPRGEENAWIHHSMMFGRKAQWALTTETRGQNSWFNFGPHSHLPVKDRPFAVQKVILLPTYMCKIPDLVVKVGSLDTRP